MRLSCWILMLAVPVSTQADDLPKTFETTRSLARQCLEQLQAHELDDALATLGQAADLNPPLHFNDDDGLAPAAGGVYRRLAQMDAAEQFDVLLKWTLPADNTVRLLSKVVPVQAPPKSFARALQERPRDNSFPIAEINGVRGLLSTGWLLVEAAEDSGQLNSLIAKLEPLAEAGVRNAQPLLLLARLADSRSDITELQQRLNGFAAQLAAKARDPAATKMTSVDPSLVVVAAAALRHRPLRTPARRVLSSLVKSSYGRPATLLRPFLRAAYATAIQWQRGESGTETLRQNRLKYWVVASGQAGWLSARGAVEPMWLAQDGHILHMTGTRNDVLFLRFPLVGEFDFTCEAHQGGTIGTDGGLVYGGLQFQPVSDQLMVYDADIAHSAVRQNPFLQHGVWAAFNRLSIVSNTTGASFEANRHPVWFDGAAARQSPWIGLRAFDDRRPLFRNVTLTGRPEIPRAVRMSEGNELRGWRSHFHNETQPPFAGAAVPQAAEGELAPAYAWTIQDAVIQAAKSEGSFRQSLLRYQRPVLEGESVSYEFYYQPGELEVHPVLDRLAFLIEPRGIRVHWITDNSREWTGLAADNAIIEPLNRRGSGPLPLKSDDWNLVTLARTDGKAAISLNDTLVYERPLEVTGPIEPAFGFYRDAGTSGVKVRNVVMTGDWPESVPDEFLANPASTSDKQSARDRVATADVIADHYLIANTRPIRRRAASLPRGDRFEFLADWILPDAGRGFRVSGEFTPLEAPLPARGSQPGDSSSRSIVLSPVYDLIDAVSDTNQLDQLRERVTSAVVPIDNSYQKRSRAALLVLIDFESRDAKAIDQSLELFDGLVDGHRPGHPNDQWPETLVVDRGLHRFPDNDALGDLAILLHQQRSSKSTPPDSNNWHTHIGELIGRYRHVGGGGSVESFESPQPLTDWIPVAVKSSKSRGLGNATPHWIPDDDHGVSHLPGHENEFLLFRSPLRGNFEIVGEIGAIGACDVFFGGQYAGPKSSRDALQIGQFRPGPIEYRPLEPALSVLREPPRFRAQVRDRTFRLWVNGRDIYRTELEEHSIPWFGFHTRWYGRARPRDIRISGTPLVPEEVLMSGSKDLTGWLPYFGGRIASDGGAWEQVDDDEIIGRRQPHTAGGTRESLLRYLRPLMEDGTVEYEFLYNPAAGSETVAHPALDRLAFLLEPDGVRIHWVTDGRHNRSDLRPDNRFDEPDNRRGPERLPLKAGEWNRMLVTIVGDTATLELNGELIYERALEADNDRTFGLFHFADVSQLRVRNVTLRGDWPNAVSSVIDQELADPTVSGLIARASRLKSSFEHDFAADGLPDRFFNVRTPEVRQGLREQPDGLHTTIRGGGPRQHISVSPRFAVHGDFEIEARFDNLDIRSKQNCSIQLGVRLNDSRTREIRAMRALNSDGRHYLYGSLWARRTDGGRDQKDRVSNSEAPSGRLRLVRLGDTIYTMFAEGDSSQFQIIEKFQASSSEVGLGGVQFFTVANGAGSQTDVLWKSIRLRAEKLMHLPGSEVASKRTLHVLEVPDMRKVRDPDVPLWEQYTRLRMKQFELSAKGEGGDEIPAVATIIGVSKQSTYSHGQLGLWTDKVGRPVAIGTAIVLGELDSSRLKEVDEFHSLHSGPIRMTDAGKEVWNVFTPGLQWQLVPDAPAPAAGEDDLFAQATELTERFTASTGAPGRPGPELQTEPLHQFAYRSDAGLRGGILAAWSIDRNPETLLALEVRPDDDDGQLKWHFAAANYSSSGQFLSLGDQPVWSESPPRFGAKIPHLGWITDNLVLEDGLRRVIPTEINELTTPYAPFTHLGSPEWSADGKQIVIDMSQGGTDTSHIVLLNADGTEVRDLGAGCMPSLSHDGKQVVFSQPGQGIVKMNLDGSEREVIERNGWGTQWSPDGRFIAFGSDNNIVLVDQKTNERRKLLTDEQASELSSIYWNLGWSHDSNWIAFKTRTRGGDESVAIARVDSSDGFKLVHKGTGINADFSWHPDSKRILFAAQDPALAKHRLYTIDRTKDDPPQQVPGQPREWQLFDGDWSPDGRHIIFSATVPPVLTEWRN